MVSFCSYFNSGQCRSCTEIKVSYSEQITKKEERVRSALAFLGPFTLMSTFRSETREFRNRAKMIVTGTSALPIIGLMGEQNLDLGRDLLECPIHDLKLNLLIGVLPRYIREYNLIPYRISERDGELKALIAFHSPESGEYYLRFVLRSQECVSRIRKLLPRLQSEFPSLVVVTANIQSIPHAILEGPEEIYLTSRTSLNHRMAHRSFNLNPQAFVQTNGGVATQLYARAAEWIKECQTNKMLELFCGQGAFSFFAAESAKELLGIDIKPEGVVAANLSAKERNLTHLHFRAADAASVGNEIAAYGPDLILVNPPRRGLGPTVDLLLRSLPSKIIYSSCSLESLASDLRKITQKYQVERVQVFDMFPHTEHFETLVLLSL